MKRCMYVVAFLFTGWKAAGQSVTLYSTGAGSLLTETQMDSLLARKNASLKGTEFTARMHEEGRQKIGDTTIIKVGLLIADSVSHRKAAEKQRFVGKPLPPFQLVDLSGQPISSADFTGRPVLINLWFTTCIPCIAEMPELNRLQKKYADKGVLFISMTYESKAAVDKFLKRKAFTFRHVPDAKEYVERFTSDYPVTLFIDRTGTIRQIESGMPIVLKRGQEISENSKVDGSEFEKALKAIAE